MRAHVIAACVTAAVLSSGVVSALAARTPSGTGSGTAAGTADTEIEELAATVESLRDRVRALETELARTRAAGAVSPTVQAPFTVVNGAGTPIFSVTESPVPDSLKGRVHIGRGSGSNFAIWIMTANHTLAATMGEQKTGGGSVTVHKGGKELGVMDEVGFVQRNSAGKEIAHLGTDPLNRSRGRLSVRGILQLSDENDNTTVDAGTLPDGRGAVRTWPNQDCKPAGVLGTPACLRGVQ
jgi:hypothetical protein